MLAAEDRSPVIHIVKGDLFVVAAEQYFLLVDRRKFFPWLINIEIIMLCETGEHVVVEQGASIPTANRAFGDGDFGMLNNPINIKKLMHTQTITGGAGASRIVKREQSWL